MYRRLTLMFGLIIAGLTSAASASVIEFTNRAAWESSVGSFTTLDFVLPPSSTPVSDQYTHLGVHFTGLLFSHEAGAYLNDGWGLRSGLGTGARVYFDEPQHWVAVDHPGAIRFELFRDGQSVYLSSIFNNAGAGFFSGLLSSEPFDEVFIHRPSGENIFIDDLHFGTIPAPGALGLLALAGLFGARKRRR